MAIQRLPPPDCGAGTGSSVARRSPRAGRSALDHAGVRAPLDRRVRSAAFAKLNEQFGGLFKTDDFLRVASWQRRPVYHGK